MSAPRLKRRGNAGDGESGKEEERNPIALEWNAFKRCIKSKCVHRPILSVCVYRCIENRAPTHLNERANALLVQWTRDTQYMYINRQDSWKYDTRH